MTRGSTTAGSTKTVVLLYYAIFFFLLFLLPPSTHSFTATVARSSILRRRSTPTRTKPLLNHHVVGKIWPTIKKLHIGPETAKRVFRDVVAATKWQDIAVLLVVAYLTLPFIRFVREEVVEPVIGADDDDDDADDSEEDQIVDDKTIPPGTKRNKILDLFKPKEAQDRISKLISGVAKVTLSVYLVEVLCIALRAIGFKSPSLGKLPVVYSKLAYSIWALRRFLELKTLLLCKLYKVHPEEMGRVEIFDRFLGGFSVALACLFLLDWLEVRMGKTMSGLVGLGSVGTLAFTFASKDLVAELISGLFLSASNKLYAGDEVQFGDGTNGKVMKLGWMETVMRENDNKITAVPNSKLANQKISNLSRVRMSHVEQTLRFPNKDADKIPTLVKDIKSEIIQTCPKLIKDGTRPFRIFWTGYKEKNLEVMVNTHFYIPLASDAYWINRQNVMMAINRAVKKNGLEFA